MLLSFRFEHTSWPTSGFADSHAHLHSVNCVRSRPTLSWKDDLVAGDIGCSLAAISFTMPGMSARMSTRLSREVFGTFSHGIVFHLGSSRKMRRRIANDWQIFSLCQLHCDPKQECRFEGRQNHTSKALHDRKAVSSGSSWKASGPQCFKI